MDLQKTSRIWMMPILALTVSSCVSVAAEQAGQLRIAPVIVQQLPSKSRILVARPRIIEGKQFTFVKYEDEKGILRAEIFNERNQRIPESALPKPQLSLITKPLQNILAQSRNPNDVFRVNIALRVETLNDSGSPTTGSAEVMENQQPKLRLNGREITEPAMRAVIQQPLQRNAQLNLKNRQLIQTRLNTLAQRHGLMNRPAMRSAIENANATLTIELKQSEILQIARQSQDLIAGIELYIEPKDEISDAMKSSRVDPHAINHAGRKGNGIGIYMTESGCPNAGHITSYRKLAGSQTILST